MTDVTKLTVALISGTGRMGVHLAAAYAYAGMNVILCSRKKESAQTIVDALMAGNGWSEGDIMVPPCAARTKAGAPWKLAAGDLNDVPRADVVLLCSPFHVMWSTLEPVVDQLRGQGKIFLDLTNPFLNSSAPVGEDGNPVEPIPRDQPQASVLYHKAKFDDPTSSWCMCYRHVFWALIHPTGPNERTGERKGIEVMGDAKAVEVCSAMITAHGFDPVVRAGGCEIAPKYEVNFYGRMCKETPPTGSEGDGNTIGPFTASPMIGLDMMGEKISRWFK